MVSKQIIPTSQGSGSVVSELYHIIMTWSMDQRNLGADNKFLRNNDIKAVNVELLDTNIFQI